MSSSYILAPVTQEFLEWGQQCDVPISRETLDGRSVTKAELTEVLESLNGFTIRIQGTKDDFNAQVDSIETVDWEYESPDPLMNQAFAGTHTSPKESVSIERLHPQNQSPSLSFHGDISLIVRIAQNLARQCGPQTAFATCDGIPAFFLPDVDSPVWNEPWV
ncbi:hypothetical protein [Gimesia fumaroli]|uniref:Uncharacterized protein n=1 Tax=Gimesia fumaroli TaxID=2527976 RepID=A0A518IK79_9PLAN|nr:hypothetical protein [Gimesia fumaroli]QDV53506.1 hypothetical protein Enr17x_55810 [Gimesia fumaroli]